MGEKTITLIPFLNNVNKYILNPVIGLLFAVAFVIFIYGIFKFLSTDVEATSRKEAQDAILYGFIGMIIMFSVYGIIAFVLKTFGVTPNDVGGNAYQFIN